MNVSIPITLEVDKSRTLFAVDKPRDDPDPKKLRPVKPPEQDKPVERFG